MSKKDTKTNTDTNTPEAAAESPSEPAKSAETALVAADTSRYLQLFVSAQQDCVNQLRDLILKADDEDKVHLERLIRAAQPVVKGREEMAQSWDIPTIRVVYGTTKDPAKPTAAKVGDMYATNGRLIKPPFKFTPLYIFESNRNFQEGQQAPVCWSPDAVLGTMFGRCNQCPHQPLGKNTSGERTDCNNGICMVVMSEDFKLYRLEFFKTSRKAGTSVDKLVRSQESLWERWYELITQQVSSGGYEYYIFKTAPHGDDVPALQVQACDILYNLIKIERKAFLEAHYEQVLSSEPDKVNVVDENVDASAMGLNVDTNPADITGGSL